MKLDIRTLSASLVAGFVSWYLCAGIYNKNADSMWTPLLMALLFLVLAAITCLVVRLTTGRRTRFMALICFLNFLKNYPHNSDKV